MVRLLALLSIAAGLWVCKSGHNPPERDGSADSTTPCLPGACNNDWVQIAPAPGGGGGGGGGCIGACERLAECFPGGSGFDTDTCVLECSSDNDPDTAQLVACLNAASTCDVVAACLGGGSSGY